MDYFGGYGGSGPYGTGFNIPPLQYQGAMNALGASGYGGGAGAGVGVQAGGPATNANTGGAWSAGQPLVQDPVDMRQEDPEKKKKEGGGMIGNVLGMLGGGQQQPQNSALSNTPAAQAQVADEQEKQAKQQKLVKVIGMFFGA